MTKKKYPEFRELLIKAIGNSRTQSEFAQQAGISAEHLNRMLNSDEINRPTIRTLNKIAGNAAGGVTINDLKKSCEYTVSDLEREPGRTNLSDEERVERCIKDIKSGFDSLGDNYPVYESIDAFVDSLNMIFSVETLYYTIGDERKLDDDSTDAEYCRDVRISFSDKGFSAETVVGIGYTKLKSGMIILCDFAFTLDKLNRWMYIDLREKEKHFDVERHDGCDVFVKYNKPYYVDHDYSQKVFQRRITEVSNNLGISFEDAFKRLIFETDNSDKRIASVEGEGFYLDRTPDYLVVEFLNNHYESFVRSDKEKEIFEAITSGASIHEAFEDYGIDEESGQACYDFWGAAVANVIYRETGIAVDCGKEDAEKGTKACILFPNAMPWMFNDVERNLSRETLVQILDRYAMELHSEMELSVYYYYEADK